MMSGVDAIWHRPLLLRQRRHRRQRVYTLDQRPNDVRQSLPGKRELYRALHPVEQRHAKFFFQLLYVRGKLLADPVPVPAPPSICSAGAPPC